MSDIYKPPESDLTTEEMPRVLPNVFWRIFFWINVILIPLILLLVYTLTTLSFLDTIDLVIFMISVIGLYLFAYAKELKLKKFWKSFCILYPLWAVFYEYIGPVLTEMTHYGEPAVIDAYNLVTLAFIIPTAYALYCLGFKSND